MYLESPLLGGTIEVIAGSMFSGKTEELIRRVKRAQIAGQKVQLFKPSTDTRYSSRDIVSHDMNALVAITVASAEEIIPKILPQTKTIAIDEAQFFDDELIKVCLLAAKKSLRVIIAGLDMDFLGRPFGPMGSLMCIADQVTKVHAICQKCGNLAQFSHRLNSGRQLVQLGQKDSYQPLCRECYNKETTKTHQEKLLHV